MYQPCFLFSYSIEYHFFGFNPLAYHATNLIFHLLNCLLVFWIVSFLTENLFVCVFTALLFGIHPMHVESVAWVTERKDVLCSFFFLGSIAAYLAYRRTGGKKYYGICFIFFILSLMTKPSGITLPLVLLLFDFLEEDRFVKKHLFEKSPFFITALFFGLLGIEGQRGNILHMNNAGFFTWDNLFYAAYAPLFYLYKIFIPLKLSCFYPFPKKTGNLLPALYLASPSFLMILIIVVHRLSKYSKKVLFGGLFFLFTVIPAIELIPINPCVVFDRYTYIPSIGIFYLMGELLWYLYQKRSAFLSLVVSILLISYSSACFYLTWQRCQVWKNTLALWTDVLKNYPRAETAYLNRGNEFKAQKRFNEAIADYRAALLIRPDDFEAFNNLGIVYNMLNERSKAEGYFKKAISLNPNYAKAWHNLGICFENESKLDEAHEAYIKALRLDPGLWETAVSLGNWYFRKQDFGQAIKMYNQGLICNPLVDYILPNLGLAYAETGDIPHAEKTFLEYLKKYPGSVPVMKNLGSLYGNSGRLLEAKAIWEEVLKIDPHDDQIRENVRKIEELTRSSNQATRSTK